MDSLVRTQEEENYDVYKDIKCINTRSHNFLLVDFPEKDMLLRLKLSNIKLPIINEL